MKKTTYLKSNPGEGTRNAIAVFIAVAIIMCNHATVFAQISMATTGVYNQNFNALASSGTGIAWADNSTIANWYSTRTTYNATTGATTAGSLYSFGTVAADRALGSINADGIGNVSYGVQFQNNSLTTITDMTVAYTGEEWRRNATADSLAFYYKISPSAISSIDISTVGWTPVQPLNFKGPQIGTALAIDGNAVANKTIIAAFAIPSLSIPAGSYVVFKWIDKDVSSSDMALSIDDASIAWTVPPVLFPSVSSLSFANQETGTNSSSQSFTVSGYYLLPTSGNITVTSPSTDFEVSPNGTSWSSSFNIAYNVGTFINADVYVRFTPQSGGAKSGSITFSGGGLVSPPSVTVSGAGKFISTQTGNWSSPSTWLGNVAPVDGNEVIIANTHTVTGDAVSNPSTLTINSGGTLLCNSSGSIGNSTPVNTISVNGTLTIPSSCTASLTFRASTLTVAGSGIFNNSAGAATVVSISNFNVDNGGTYNHDAEPTGVTGSTSDFPGTVRSLAPSSSVIITRWGGTGVPVPIPGITYGNLTINILNNLGNAIQQNASITSIMGNLNMMASGVPIERDFRFTANNSLTLYVGGSINVTGGKLVIANGSASPIINLMGGLNVTDGHFNTNTGSGTLAINFLNGGSGDLNLSGGLVNNGNITIEAGRTVNLLSVDTMPVGTLFLVNGTLNCGANVIRGDGAFTLSDGATLGIGAADGIAASSITGNVQVTGSRTFGSGSNYVYNGSVTQFTGDGLPSSLTAMLKIDNALHVRLTSPVTVTNVLNLNQGILKLAGNNITLTTGASVTGTFSSTSMIATNGTGELRREFAGTGSFVFPVGDTILTPEYSPITLSFTSGSFSSAYAGVRVTDAKHPNNANSTNYLSRYWTVTQSGISTFTCDVNASYTDDDITGSETSIASGKWNGSTPWLKYGLINDAANTLSVNGVNSFSDFTGISNVSPSVSIAEGLSVNICRYYPLTLTTAVVADPSIAYAWSGGLGNAASASPSTAATGSTVYTVTVTDGNGFTSSTTTSVTVIASPNPVISGNNSICTGTTTTFDAGSGFNSYLWSTGASSQTITTGIASTYTVTVSGSNGCTKSTSIILTVNSLPIVNVVTSDANCFGSGGSATANASGGGGGYTYHWSTSATTVSVSGLAPATYTVTVTDVNVCTKTATGSLSQPAQLIVDGIKVNVKCRGSNTGSIDITASGGTIGSGYTYVWNNGSHSEDQVNLSAGTFTVTVTDSHGCTVTHLFTVTQPSSLISVSAVKTNVRCGGKATGSATAMPSGGVSPYQYVWGNGSTDATRNNLAAGDYTVTVTDAAGCTKTKSVTITENVSQTVSVVPMPSNQYFASNSGGVGPYTYSWNTSPVQTIQTATIVSAGSYKVKVTDSKGCTVLSSAFSVSRIEQATTSDMGIATFPNPTKGLITLNVSHCINCNATIVMFDAIGKIVYSKEMKVESNTILDFSGLLTGIYSMRVTYDGKIEVVKIVVQ